MSETPLVRLSPPWYTFFDLIKYTIGKDDQVKVLEMEEVDDRYFLIPIEVNDEDKAIALATILTPYKEYGNIKVYAEVLYCGKVVKPDDKKQNVCSLYMFYKEALESNDYFAYVEFRDFFGKMILYPVFKKEVVQFFNDNMADLYNNYNAVAADAFAEVLELEIDDVAVRPSTVMENI